MQKLVVLTGAGMSAESGIQTFRGSGGLWEGYDVMTVASPEGWEKDPQLVLDFYNARRENVRNALPNKGHLLLAEMENYFDVEIITQNIDDLHERAGSTKILHLHGEIDKCRSTINDKFVIKAPAKMSIGDLCPNGGQLRPHIVWFGEEVPEIANAIPVVQSADILVIIGTSMDVYPAAGLSQFAIGNTPIFLIDPNPSHQANKHFTHIVEVASKGLEIFLELMKKNGDI